KDRSFTVCAADSVDFTLNRYALVRSDGAHLNDVLTSQVLLDHGSEQDRSYSCGIRQYQKHHVGLHDRLFRLCDDGYAGSLERERPGGSPVIGDYSVVGGLESFRNRSAQ